MVRACDLKATEQLPKRLLGHVWSTFALMFIVNTCGYVFINDFLMAQSIVDHSRL